MAQKYLGYSLVVRVVSIFCRNGCEYLMSGSLEVPKSNPQENLPITEGTER